LRNAGVIVATAHDLSEALKLMEGWGVLVGHTVLTGTSAPVPKAPAASYLSTRPAGSGG
jgi:ABC-type proline/glycine betaine transport system ATPase subunit